ncbi:hypothetical protein, variant 1 [Capsaspora owczarzaki ATCC 30864]|nr:hypothetical protein, variant 1 [Capsaspora owczarzaki ATCC 30864]
MSSSHTYLAYNDYGGKSAYDFNSNNARSYKVTYDRPYATTIGVIPGSRNVSTDYGVGSSFILGPRAGWEYAFVRFVEQEGYDVMYFDNQDLHNGYAIAPPRFRTGIIVGHDEYWSNEMRNAVEAARNQGLSLAFFAANVCFWKVRFEQSPTSGQANRVMVIYRDADKDPYFNTANSNMVTTRWRWDPNPRPENMLLGVMYNYDPVVDQPLVVADGLHWMFKGTSLRTGSSIPGLLGYEVDETLGSTLPNLRVVFESPYTFNETQLVRNSHGVMSRMPNGAFTFATGSIQWAWGLDNDLVTPKERRLYMNDDIKQITRNILAVFADPPAPGLEPLMSAYNVVANDCPSATGGLVLNTFSSGSLVANDLGRAMNDDGTMSASVAGGRLSLTSTANGYWYSMLGNSGGTCFDGSLYNALTLTVRAPPGTDFQIQLQSRDSSCMNTVTSIVSAAQYAQTQGGWSASADRRFIIPFGAFPNLAPGKLTALVLAKVTPVGATVSIDDVMLTSCASMGESGPISQPPVDNPPRVCSSSALAVDTFANANMEMNDLGLYTSDDDTMTAMSLSSGQLRLTAPDPGAYWYTLLANANQCRDMSSYAAIQFSIQAPVGTKLILQLQFRNDRCKGWEGSSELQLAGFTGAQQTIRVPFTDFDTAVPASRLFAVSVFGLSGSPAPISISLDDLVFAC